MKSCDAFSVWLELRFFVVLFLHLMVEALAWRIDFILRKIGGSGEILRDKRWING
jgi:hypothetical protein